MEENNITDAPYLSPPFPLHLHKRINTSLDPWVIDCFSLVSSDISETASTSGTLISLLNFLETMSLHCEVLKDNV